MQRKYERLKRLVCLKVALNHRRHLSFVVVEVRLCAQSVDADRVEVVHDGCLDLGRVRTDVLLGLAFVQQHLTLDAVLENADILRPAFGEAVEEASCALGAALEADLVAALDEVQQLDEVVVDIWK